MGETQLPVVTAIDDNYVYPLLLSAFTAARTGRPGQRWMVASDAALLSVQSRAVVTEVLSGLGIRCEMLDLQIAGRFTDNGHITATSFARLPLADVLDDFVWLDVDVMCLDGWDSLLDTRALAASGHIAQARPLGEAMRWREQADHNAAFQRAGARYFNSGVMRLSGSRWRAAGFPDAWPRLFERYAELGFQWNDQCVLNHLLAGDYMDLDMAFNCGPDEPVPGGYQPRIVHFTGSAKPWRYPPDARFARQEPRRSHLVAYWEQERQLIEHVHAGDPALASVIAQMGADHEDLRPIDLSRTWQRITGFTARVQRRLSRRQAVG